MEEISGTALLGASMAALNAALHSWRILANRGLVSPEEIDEMAHGISVALPEDDPASAKLLAIWNAGLLPQVAQIQRVARANWRTPDGPR